MKHFALIVAIAFSGACGEATSKSNNANSSSNSSSNSATNGGTNNSTSNPGVCLGFIMPDAPDGTCRSGADCEGGADCSPGPNTSCGALMVPMEECVEDSDCGDGNVCESYTPTGPCTQGTGTRCIESCSTAECEDGFSCGDDGQCTPTSCEDGFACTGDTLCDPARDLANGHGCAPLDCALDDFTCPDGLKCDAAGVSNNHCVPIHCAEGAECPFNFDCNPEGPGDGCQKRSCASDGDCHCGACIGDRCEPHLWICTHAAA